MSYNFPEEEHKILKFWEKNRIFEKLREKNKRGNPSTRSARSGQERWSFLDGPITANNPMGVHHAWGRTYKDLLQRYYAMKGFEERYQNGFDCQGLWVEVEVEKELGFKNKKDIEAYGIDKFVQKCKERVRKYSAIQTRQSIRLGQWMDWENSYYTMSDENNYAIWHFLKKCWKDGYLYKGRDSVPWCPRCGTAISQHEILTEEYKEIVHKSVYFKLPITEGELKGKKFLVWTTTPWTIPANVALAVGKDIDYVEVEIFDKYNENGDALYQNIILAKAIYEVPTPKNILKEYKLATRKSDIKLPKIVKEFKGGDLKGIKYEGPFDSLPRVKKAETENSKTFHVVILDKDLVTETEGTGIVHIAPGAGEEDFKIGKKENLSVIDVIDEAAVYLDGIGEFSGKSAKMNPEIIFNYLKNYDNGKFFHKIKDFSHRYPTCWRCKTELVWRVVDEWYISMDGVHANPKSEILNPKQIKKSKSKSEKTLRESLMEIAKTINWIPEFGRERELDWLKNMHDWLISKKRYWGLALPIFECKECRNFEVIGSREELKKRAVEGWESFEGKSPHRPWVDNVKIKCRVIFRDPDSGRNKKCKAVVSRIKDVGNPWLDAGIVPFSTMQYFSDKSYWKKWFPAEIVCESFPGQFKNWFYSLLVMSAALEDTAPVKTIFGYASVRDEKGEEMHKSKGNAIWFDEAVEKIGADPMRWFYARSNPADNANFGYNVVEEIKRKLLILYNVYSFFGTYVPKKEFPGKFQGNLQNILDRWIISKVNHLIGIVDFNLEKYDMAKAVLAIEDFFINDLSLWYVRRSRKRFSNPGEDRNQAIQTLYHVLLTTAKMISPAMPFFAEHMYQSLKNNGMTESVHLCDWPEVQKETDLDLEQKMDEARDVVSLVLAERSILGIKVRQPLGKLKVKNEKSKVKYDSGLLTLIKDEVNVKEIVFDDTIKKDVELDTIITQELKEEGTVRDIIRSVQEIRKESGLKPGELIIVKFSGTQGLGKILENNTKFILKEITAQEYGSKEDSLQWLLSKEIKIDQQKLLIKIKRL